MGNTIIVEAFNTNTTPLSDWLNPNDVCDIFKTYFEGHGIVLNSTLNLVERHPDFGDKVYIIEQRSVNGRMFVEMYDEFSRLMGKSDNIDGYRGSGFTHIHISRPDLLEELTKL